MPVWASILDMAQDLHIPPWQIEEECTATWWFQYWTFRKNTNRATRQQQEKIDLKV